MPFMIVDRRQLLAASIEPGKFRVYIVRSVYEKVTRSREAGGPGPDLFDRDRFSLNLETFHIKRVSHESAVSAVLVGSPDQEITRCCVVGSVTRPKHALLQRRVERPDIDSLSFAFRAAHEKYKK